MSNTKRAKRDPDKEPFPYPAYYRWAAIRNPTALTIVGAVLLAAGLVAYAYILTFLGAPAGPQRLSPAVAVLAAVIPIAFAIVLWIGIVRLRWQRSYIRRHGVKPAIVGQRTNSN
jgi:hypothetical protein